MPTGTTRVGRDRLFECAHRFESRAAGGGVVAHVSVDVDASYTGAIEVTLDAPPDGVAAAPLVLSSTVTSGVLVISADASTGAAGPPQSGSRGQASPDPSVTAEECLGGGHMLATLGFAGEVLSVEEFSRMVPLTALALVLPQSKFDQAPVAEAKVQRLFCYTGPKSRIVWTHAWRRLAAGVGPQDARHPAREGVLEIGRAHV